MMKTETLNIESLIPYAKNSRTHSAEQVAQIASSIREFGWTNPVLIDGQGTIIAGHGRVMAARALNIVEIPCIRLTHLSESQVRAYVIADNKLALNAGWDEEMLNSELRALAEEGDIVKMTGFSDEELAALLEPQTELHGDPDEVPELPVEPITKVGDLWTLGEHRVLCGDSTKAEDVERLMGGAKADMVFTDPPYGVQRDKGFGGFGGFGAPIARRKYSDEWDADRPSKETFSSILSLAKDAILFGGNFFADLLPRSTHWIVWDKQNTMPTFGDCELAWTNISRKSVKKYTVTYNGLIGKEKERFHPTQKPVELLRLIVADYSEPYVIIVDPFLGSGTTLIAAEQLGRKCYGMEISTAYCDVIINRWQNLTGKTATHAVTGKPFNDRPAT